MNFKEKLRCAFYKIKTRLIVGAVLMLLILIAGGAPLSIGFTDAINNRQENTMDLSGGLDWEIFYLDLGEYIPSPFKALKKCFQPDYFPAFFNAIKIVLIVYGLFAGIGFFKAIPKHEYDDIEHGSSKWSEGGEQYAILSKKKGIILAEKHYLPVDKRGNVNVLVVRRFRSW